MYYAVKGTGHSYWKSLDSTRKITILLLYFYSQHGASCLERQVSNEYVNIDQDKLVLIQIIINCCLFFFYYLFLLEINLGTADCIITFQVRTLFLNTGTSQVLWSKNKQCYSSTCKDFSLSYSPAQTVTQVSSSPRNTSNSSTTSCWASLSARPVPSHGSWCLTSESLLSPSEYYDMSVLI